MNRERIGAKEAISILIRAFGIGLSVKNATSIICSIVGLLGAFLPVAISKALEIFSNEIQILYWGGTNYIKAEMLAILLAVLYIAQVGFQCFQDYCTKVEALKISKYIKENVIRNTCDVEYKYINNTAGYLEKIGLADEISGSKTTNAIQTTTIWLQKALSFGSVFIVLKKINGWITIILIITSIPAILLANHQNDETFKFTTRRIKTGQLLMNNFTEMVGPKEMTEIRYLGIIEYLKRQWKASAQDYIKQKKNLIKKHVRYNSVADIFRNIAYVFILFIVVNRIFNNPALGIGEFMLVFTLAKQFQENTTSLIISILDFFDDASYIKAFFDLEDYPKEGYDNYNENSKAAEVEFKNVSFTYPESRTEVLHDINLHIRSGEKIAIVGENGSGKTTFINLLCGFFMPTDGDICINGENLFDNLSKIRNQMAIVFQDFPKYETSIKDNIIVSCKDNAYTDKELNDICQETGLKDIIGNFPLGINEEVGLFSEYGRNLSGGEWQRIALARAAIRRNTGIMILDEPTSALDPKAESNIYDKFSRISKEKTTVLVTHRLGAIKLVDRIIVFKDGRIVEEGNHDALMKKNGVYSEMYRAQARWYK